MAAAAPYIIAAVGTAASVAADRQANRERRSILNRAMERNDQEQEKNAAETVAEGKKFGAQRLQAMEQQEQSALAQALSDVGGSPETGAGASIIDTAGGEGAVSGDFIKAKADRALSEGDRLTAVARELSKVRAPGQLQLEEGMSRADLAERLASRGYDARSRANAASLDAQNVQAPWWGTAGKIAASLGSAGIGGAAGAATGAASQAWQQGAAQQRLGETGGGGFWGSQGSRIRFGGK